MTGRVSVIIVKYGSMEDKFNILALPIRCPEIFEGAKTLRLFLSYSNDCRAEKWVGIIVL